ncbi:MAG: M90 family metallopeptidase [Betaproteobacteria bacterium]
MTALNPLNPLKSLTRLFRRARSLVARNVPLIDETLWRNATRNYVFVRSLSAEENRRLRLIASDFLSRKTITGAGGLEIDERIRVQVAAQACILVLELGMRYYEGWKEIIIYPSAFMREREYTDEAGVVHTTRDPLAGEAWFGGPVVLSHDDIVSSGNDASLAYGSGHNVVIHEFAHKLDMRNGLANGFPPLQRGMSREGWRRAFMGAYLEFCKAVDAAEARQHADHGEALDALPLDPYAAENPAEFFAVISEAFFELPDEVAEAFPVVYEQLTKFYRQNPAARLLR